MLGEVEVNRAGAKSLGGGNSALGIRVTSSVLSQLHEISWAFHTTRIPNLLEVVDCYTAMAKESPVPVPNGRQSHAKLPAFQKVLPLPRIISSFS